MKKIITVLSCVLTLTLAASCDWFKLDNQEGWDASVEGQILDAGTNQPIQFAQYTASSTNSDYLASRLTVVEKGWKAEENQYWTIKTNGSYKNTLVFSGQYTMNTLSSNFTCDPQSFELKKGENKVDFKVTPYVRIENVTWAMEGKKIKVTCKVSSPVPSVNNLGEVRLCIAVDRFVSMSDNGAAKDPNSYVTDVDPSGTTVTLYIDPEYKDATGQLVNAAEFQYDQVHYVRVAAMGAHYTIVPEWTEENTEIDWDNFPWALLASDWSNFNDIVVYKTTVIVHPASYSNDGSVNSGSAYNYSPVYKLDLKAGTFTEVTDW